MILKLVIRNLVKHPFLNLIKVIGLSLALCGVLFIVLFLKNELTFDCFHKKSDRIFRFTKTNPAFFNGKHFARTYNASFIPEMTDYFPEIKNYVRLAPYSSSVVKFGKSFIDVKQAFQCDSTFFEIFDAKLIVGNPDHVLDQPGLMVLSESYAKKIFGEQNPIGNILTLPKGQYIGEDVDFMVCGIMKDFPPNSHFHPEFVVTPKDRSYFNGWAWTYLLLAENADPDKITSEFKRFYSTYLEQESEGIEVKTYLQNISSIHLHSDKLREIEPNSSMLVIYTLALAVLILLFIAIFNYANLNIGMAVFNSKYIFISAMSGSRIWNRLKYVLTEGIIIAGISIVFAFLIVGLANLTIQKQFGVDLLRENIIWITYIVGIFIFLTILVATFPLLNQLGIKVRSVLDYKNRKIFQKREINKSLIVLQYAILIILLVAVFVIQRQTNYALDKSMSNETDSLICFEYVHANVQKKFGLFKRELLKYNSIRDVSAMLEPPGGEANDRFRFLMQDYKDSDDEESNNMIGVFPCDYSFPSIFNLTFLSGENFSKKNDDPEGLGEYIINEAAMKHLNYINPNEIIGKEFDLEFDYGDVNIPSGKIIGVVEDFHLSNIKKKIEPLVFFKKKDIWLLNFIVSFHPGMIKTALADIENVWMKLFPEYSIQFEDVNSMYESVYEKEILQAKLLSAFVFIALVICSMGLLGLALLATQKRIKEIGIRKVNGARTNEILFLLNMGVLKWIIVAIVIGIPLAYFLMDKWLENYAYKVSLNWWIFILAALATILIAFITISSNSLRAALRNPIEALRYE